MIDGQKHGLLEGPAREHAVQRDRDGFLRDPAPAELRYGVSVRASSSRDGHCMFDGEESLLMSGALLQLVKCSGKSFGEDLIVN